MTDMARKISVVFAMLMMLAFLVDQTQQLCCALFQAVWAKLGSKRLLWERMRALFYDYALTSMRPSVRGPLVWLYEVQPYRCRQIPRNLHSSLFGHRVSA